MSTHNNSSISISKKLMLKIAYLVLIALLIILFWVFRNFQVDKMIDKQQEQVSNTILRTINEQAKLDLFMPNIVFINIDSTNKKLLADSIKNKIARVLTTKYLTNQKAQTDQIDFQPFFVFPNSADKKGNYIITGLQLEQLKNHIVFLSSQVDKAVAVTKDEVNKDISRISTLVSIWIGVLCFLGVLIPILINYKVIADLKEIESNATAANSKAEVALDSATKADNLTKKINAEIEKVKGIPAELVELKKTFTGFENDVKTAKKDSGEAIVNAKCANDKAVKVEKLIFTLNDISKIKDIDAAFLLYNNKPLETLKSYLLEIHTNLSNCTELFSEPIVKDVFRQLSLKLHLLAPSGFISPEIFDLLNQFALDLSNIIIQPMTQESYNEALTLLCDLNKNIVK